jgi:hypothetical protein
MKILPLLIALTLVNLVLLIFTLARVAPAASQDVAPLLRGRGLQIVDERGNVRASIAILPPTTQKNGELSPETVLLRLITEKGRPSVKIGASEESAGMALVGPTGTKNTYVQVGAKGMTSSLTLKDEDGREQTITP